MLCVSFDTEAFYMQHMAVVDEVMGLCPSGRSRSSVNNVALHDCQNCQTSTPA